MRWIAVVVTFGLVFVVANVHADTPGQQAGGAAGAAGANANGAAGAAVPTPSQPLSACDQCEDLCRLVDAYEQKAAAAEMFRPYAHPPEGGGAALPAGVTNMDTLEKAVFKQWDQWNKLRTPPCQYPAAGKVAVSGFNRTAMIAQGKAPPATADTQLETNMACQVLFEGKPLTGDAVSKFEAMYNCKAQTDALREHENVHVEMCTKAWADAKGVQDAAVKTMDDPRNVADSEVKSYGREAEVLADQIRKIVQQKGCGWHPTKAQQQNPKSQPTHDQLDKMHTLGWGAVEALGGKGPK